MHVFEGTTADEVWLQAAAKFRHEEMARFQSSRAGETRELAGAVFVLSNPRERWILSREPAINPAFALAEVVWIVSGRRDSKFLNYWNPKLPKFAGTGKNYHGAYGFRLRHQFGIDQMDRAYHALRNNPDTRQVVLQIWDPSDDFPHKDGTPTNPDIPCNVCSFAKIREGKLNWTQIVRSNDLYLGVPHNFVQFTCLQEILAAWLSIDVGEYRHLSDSLHFYLEHEKSIDEASPIIPERNVDVLRFTKNDSDRFFNEISRRMDRMTASQLSEKKLRDLVKPDDFPKELQNWLLVIAADCARRRKWLNLTYELIIECSNPVLRQLWDRWLDRWWQVQHEEKISADAKLFFQPWLSLKFS